MEELFRIVGELSNPDIPSKVRVSGIQVLLHLTTGNIHALQGVIDMDLEPETIRAAQDALDIIYYKFDEVVQKKPAIGDGI